LPLSNASKELQNQVKSQHVVGVGLVSQDALGHHLRKAGLASAFRGEAARRFLAVADGSPWEGFMV